MTEYQSTDLQITRAANSFQALLEARQPILGEEEGGYEALRDAVLASLTPFTPYERLMAENLIAIEWEVLQKRSVLAAQIRKAMHAKIVKAVVDLKKQEHEASLDKKWDEHLENGGTKKTWDPDDFPSKKAEEFAIDIANDATARDPETVAATRRELEDMGIDPILLMSDAYLERGHRTLQIEEDIKNLERRRRDIKKDYDTLQTSRPLIGEALQ